MILSTGDIKNDYQIIDLVFAYGTSNEDKQKACKPLEAYSDVSKILAHTAGQLGADAVINIRFDTRVAAEKTPAGGSHKVFEVYGYGTAVKIIDPQDTQEAKKTRKPKEIKEAPETPQK